MHFEGTVTIRAPREQVWRFLIDPQAVSRCAPGLESMEILVPDRKFRAVTSVGFGAIKARFESEAEWVELDPPNRAKMKVHGTAPGSAVDATSEMALSDEAEGTTEMRWSAEVTIVGAIASLAARLMGGVTQRLTAAFFDCVKQQIEKRGQVI
jgi:carbon monoxide dehydrogenase subunit G